MGLKHKKSKRYNFYLAKFWPCTILALGMLIDILAIKILMASHIDVTLYLCASVFVIASLIMVKFIALLARSRQPIITIHQGGIVIKHKNRLEIPFDKINSIKLATSGFQLFSQSLLIFLNNTSDNESSDLPVISVPLLFVRADRKHLLQLLKLHLNRKPYDVLPATTDLDLDAQAI